MRIDSAGENGLYQVFVILNYELLEQTIAENTVAPPICNRFGVLIGQLDLIGPVGFL